MLAPGVTVVCYLPEPNAPWKIHLPTSLMSAAIRWYHLSLGHQGSTRLYETMATHFHNPNLKNRIEELVSHCDTCQRQKQVLRGHGHTAPREAGLHPWREVAVDTIGPWTINIGNETIKFHALTMIDTVTNLVELVRLDNHTSANAALHFNNSWLCRYP